DQLLGSRSDEVSFTEFIPKAGLNYKLTPYISVYTSYGLSSDIPGTNELDNPPILDPNDPFIGKPLNHRLEPSKSQNFELGIKGNVIRPQARFLKKLLFETTFFNYAIDNDIIPFEILTEVYFQNTGRTHRRGLEIGADMNVLKGLNLNFAYTYSDFQFDDYIAQKFEISGSTFEIDQERDFSGNFVPSIPEHNLSVSFSYAHKLAKNLTGFSKVSDWITSGMYVDDANSEQTDGYQVVDFTLGLDVTINRFNLILSGGVRNVFDETYVAFINTNSADRRFYEAGAPRNYFGNIKFGYTL
ncbi:MAG: TonB-dependent receptor, partial [candidate division Zixibacteria bacterium]|nr:TonB-dependent receptor [candidate division Zixibacteria bacterium]NIW40526.1 TonB-dependent receptor [candidate division Zixibacteria bacterium]NIX57835.1 TonB-dependent receptor [candidate division Zixibacteria bacterium]